MVRHCAYHAELPIQAPEVYKGERIRPKVDVYSFAVCLWQMHYREIVCCVCVVCP